MLMERFQDLLDQRASQYRNEDGANFAYKTGYLLALITALANTNPQVAERIASDIKYLEAYLDPITEQNYMGA